MSEPVRVRPTRVKFGGAAAILAGISYGAAGYLDTPGVSGYTSVLVSVLSVATPALFFGGLLGIHALLAGDGGSVERVGFLVGCLGTTLGVVDALTNTLSLDHTFLGLTSVGFWWWVLLLIALVLIGLAALPDKARWSLGTLVLVSSVLGWVSLLTDPAFSSVLVPTRAVHVSFAVLFCTSAILWGWALLRAAP